MTINLLDFYWLVGTDTAQVYCSKRQSFVPVTDAAYVAWIAQGFRPAVTDSAETLAVMLQPYGLVVS